MNEIIMDGLFYGGITGISRSVKPSLERQRINKKIEDECRYFFSKMSVDDCQRLKKLEELYYEASAFVERDSFGYGFRLGVMLMSEVFFSGISSPAEQNQ